MRSANSWRTPESTTFRGAEGDVPIVSVIHCVSPTNLSIRIEGNILFEAKFPVETPAETPHRVANDDQLGTG